ncbi:MAG: tetratricopeptide repeat protein, partial [Burkholderiales bacterium]
MNLTAADATIVEPFSAHDTSAEPYDSLAGSARGDSLRTSLEQVAAGRITEGMRGLLVLIRETPNDPAVLHAIAIASLQMGDIDASERFLGRALEITLRSADRSLSEIVRGDLAAILFLRGRSLDQEAQLAAAEEVYRRVVTLAPDHAKAWRRLMQIALAYGDIDATTAALKPLLILLPRDPDVQVGAGECANMQGDTGKAIGHFRRALDAMPDHCIAGLGLAVLLTRQGDLKLALRQLRKTARANPNDRAVRFELARVLILTEHHSEGNTELQLAQALPDLELFDIEPIRALIVEGRFQDAEEATKERRAREPDGLAGYLLQGILCEQRRDPHAAAYWFSRAFEIQPGNPIACIRWAFRLGNIGASEASKHVLERCLLRWPAYPVAIVRRALTVPPIAPDLETLAQSRRTMAHEIKELERSGPALSVDDLRLLSSNFWLSYQGGDDRPLQEALARYYLRAAPFLNFEAPHVRRRTQRPRLRIGMLSSFFSNHIVGRLYHRIIERLDRKRYEIVLIHTADTASDASTDLLNALAAQVVRLPQALLECQRLVAALELDVLFYPDIGMSHDNYFLAFGRYARVQCTSWGHPTTSGIPNIDYYISSERLEIPGAQSHYSEELVRFRDLPVYWDQIG